MLSKEMIYTSCPDLVEIQHASFKKFLSEGLAEVLNFLPTISDPAGKLELKFYGQEYKLKFPRYSVRRAKSRDRTYSAQIYVPAKLDKIDVLAFNKSNSISFIGESQILDKKYKKKAFYR